MMLLCVLQMLLDFLDKVIKERANKMTAENVAMVMAPNLFLLSSGSRSRPQAMDRELKLAVATSKVTLLLLSNRTSLWTVKQLLRRNFDIWTPFFLQTCILYNANIIFSFTMINAYCCSYRNIYRKIV